MSFDTEYDYDFNTGEDWCYRCKQDGRNIVILDGSVFDLCKACQFKRRDKDDSAVSLEGNA